MSVGAALPLALALQHMEGVRWTAPDRTGEDRERLRLSQVFSLSMHEFVYRYEYTSMSCKYEYVM